jgi:hypothetical protein
MRFPSVLAIEADTTAKLTALRTEQQPGEGEASENI